MYQFPRPLLKYLWSRGLPACTCVSRAHSTTTRQVVHHRIALVELYQYAKFRVGRSKFPEYKVERLCICICIVHVRNTCTMHPITKWHAPSPIEPHQCTKFGVDSSKFPRTGGPLSNKIFRSWRAQPAPHTNGNQNKHIGWDSRHLTCTSGISGAHRLTCRGGKTKNRCKTCARAVHVYNAPHPFWSYGAK